MDYSVLTKACKFSCWKRSKKKEAQAAPPPPPAPPPEPPQPPAPPAPPPHHEVGHRQGPGPHMGRYMDDFERLARHPRFGYVQHTRTWRLGFDTGYEDDYYYYNTRHENGPHPSVCMGPPGSPSRRENGPRGYHSSPPLIFQDDHFYQHGPPPPRYRGPPAPPPHGEFALRPYRSIPPDPYYYPESAPPGAYYYPPAPYYYGHDENPNECSTM